MYKIVYFQPDSSGDTGIQDGPYHLCAPGDDSRQCGPSNSQGRGAVQTENQNEIQRQIQYDCRRADQRTPGRMSGVFHDAEINLRYAAHEIGEGRNLKIFYPAMNQDLFRGEKAHDLIREKKRSKTEHQRNSQGYAEYKSKYFFHSFCVAFSPVLCGQHTGSHRKCCQEQVEYKHDLSSE